MFSKNPKTDESSNSWQENSQKKVEMTNPNSTNSKIPNNQNRQKTFVPKPPLIKERRQIPSRILNEKSFSFSKVVSFLLLVGILIFGSSFYLWQNSPSTNLKGEVMGETSSQIAQNTISSSQSSEQSSMISSVSSSANSSAKPLLVDNKGIKISEFIRKNSNIDMGILSSETLTELKIKPPIDVSKIEQGVWQSSQNSENSKDSVSNSQSNSQNSTTSNNANKTVNQKGEIIVNAQIPDKTDATLDKNRPPKTLEEISPKPSDLEDKSVEPKTVLSKKNLLVFPKYNIEVPIIHLTFDQMYPRNRAGETDFNSELDYPLDRPKCRESAAYRDTCHPVQKMLELGSVHLPMSVHPGEIGTSYIAAHTSNWAFINSPYNSIFKPMEGKTQVGDEFFVFDNWGRKLKFRIFESLEIRAEDLDNAYKKFGDRRTITLQGSVLKWTKQGLQPTHRWLSRGELVEEDLANSSSNSSISSNNSNN